MVWGAEAEFALPDFNPYEAPNFVFCPISPIITVGADRYIYTLEAGNVNFGSFYRYNLVTQAWTMLASAVLRHDGYSGGIAVSPDGTRLALPIGGNTAVQMSCRRIGIYTIATDAWVYSDPAPDIPGPAPVTGYVASVVWDPANLDIIWAWGSTRQGNGRVKCFQYRISTDTWTSWTNNTTGVISTPVAAAIRANGSVVYGASLGANIRGWVKYTIAIDTYSGGTWSLVGDSRTCLADPRRLWFYTQSPIGRFQYLDVENESENLNIFSANPAFVFVANTQFGGTQGVTDIIAVQRPVALALMSEKTSVPVVTTQLCTDVAADTATGHGTIVDSLFSPITQHGHCWSVAPNPTIADPRTLNGAGALGAFSSAITGLDPALSYYVRAYATNTEGTGYGANIRIGLPTVQTLVATGVT